MHVNPLIRGKVSVDSNFQEIRGKSRRCVGIGIVGAEGEDAEGAADLGLAEGGGFGFAEGAEFAGAALDDGAGNFV